MRRRPTVPPSALLAAAWLVACALSSPARAQCVTSVLTVPGAGDFGASVSTDGKLALIGDPTGEAAGLAWLLERGPWTWTLVERFTPQPGTAGNARYGEAVAVHGGFAAVGAPGEAGAAGAVYVYRAGAAGWTLVGRLMAPDAEPGARFGQSLALRDALLAVGAPRDDGAADGAGAAYLFALSADGWTATQKLVGAGVLPGEGLGASLALRDGVLAAGTQSAGTVWVFEQSAEDAKGFLGTAVLELPNAGKLGRSLALDGGRLLAGSPSTHATAIQSGAAHLFERTGAGWALAATLVPPEAMYFAQFGAAVALDGPVAVIGAPAANAGDGAVYVLREQAGAWGAFATLAELPGAAYAGLGGAFGLSGEHLVAGAADPLGPPGVAFSLGGFRPWEPLGGGVGGTGGVPTLSVQASLCGGTAVTLAVDGGKPSATVLFVIGFEAAPAPFHGGTLWPAPDLLRFGTLDAAGGTVLAGTWPISHPGMQSVYAQAWMTDATAPGGLAATHALRTSTP